MVRYLVCYRVLIGKITDKLINNTSSADCSIIDMKNKVHALTFKRLHPVVGVVVTRGLHSNSCSAFPPFHHPQV